MDRRFDQSASQYWQSRAEEVRAKADAMHDASAKATMIMIAEKYERMALRMAQKQG